MDRQASISYLLGQWSAGDAEAADALVPRVYRELRRIAASLLRRERGARTLETGDLVHEAWLRLRDPAGFDFRDRRHFFNIAGRAMRQVLVDRARRRGAGKRGGDRLFTSLEEAAELPIAGPLDVLSLDRILEELARLDRRQAQIVELKVFAGLELADVAAAIEVSLSTVKRDWRMARAWIASQLLDGGRR